MSLDPSKLSPKGADAAASKKGFNNIFLRNCPGKKIIMSSLISVSHTKTEKMSRFMHKNVVMGSSKLKTDHWILKLNLGKAFWFANNHHWIMTSRAIVM